MYFAEIRSLADLWEAGRLMLVTGTGTVILKKEVLGSTAIIFLKADLKILC